MKHLGLAAALGVAVAACDPSPPAEVKPPPGEGSDPPASSVVPEPRSPEPAIASAGTLPTGSSPSASATPPPVPLTVGEALVADVPPPAGSATTTGTAPKAELAGVELEARWTWPGSVNAANEPSPRPKVEPDHLVQLTSNGRMRVRFSSPRLPLPVGTELTARADRYGTLLVWPDHGAYRILAVGMLRATVGDRRLDATPLSKATLTERGEATRLGLPVRRLELKSSYGTLLLELARVREAGLGGAALCRTLVEWASIDPATPACRTDGDAEVPLGATFRWGPKGEEAARFEVTKLTPHEKDASPVAVPAAEQRPRPDGIPGSSSAVLVTSDEQSNLGGGKDTGAKGGASKVALNGVNRSDRTMFLVVDGVPVAYLAPNGRVRLEALRPGHHRVEWRSFFGEEVSEPTDVEPPLTVRYPSKSSEDEEPREEAR